MKAIIITEKRLDELFDKCVDKLKLEKFMERETDVNSLHKGFHYWVEILRQEIKDDETDA